MLDRHRDSIVYQSYGKIGELSYKIAVNSREGLDGTREQEELWLRLVKIDHIIDTIIDVIEIKNNSIYRVIGISDEDFNQLLGCLEDLAEIDDYPIATFIPSRHAIQITSGAAQQGQPGTNGVSAYMAIAFASDNIGTNLSSTPDISRPFIAFVSSNTNIPFIAATFAGKWTKYIGDIGPAGTNGTNGTSYFTYIRYASDTSGTNFSATPDVNRKYVAYLTSPTDLGLTPPSTAFNGLWTKYIGDNGIAGTNGTNGKTILITSGAPDNAIGTNGDVAIDNVNWNIHLKSNDVWSVGVSLIGPPGPTGSNGTNGNNGLDGAAAFLYIAWADDAAGNGFTTVFDPNKEWIAVLPSTVDIPAPDVADFAGLFSKYRGDGDRWKTTSITSLTIGTGVKALIVGTGLAYSTGQRFVIAVDNDPNNRMEGLVINYDQITGQFTGEVTDVFGSGTFSSWDVNLSAAIAGNLTADSYYAEIYTSANSGGTPQVASGTYTKIDQFLSLGDISGGMAGSFAADTLTPGVVGEFHIYANLIVSGTAGAEFEVALFKDGVEQPGFKSAVTLDAAGSPANFSLEGLKAVISGQVFELRFRAVTGTPNFLVEEARFGMFTTGTPATPEYTQFGGLDFDTAVGTVIDAFPTTEGNAVIWEYKIKKGNNIKTGRIQGCWDGLGNDNMDDGFSSSLGTIDVVLDVDINGGNVRLLATLTSDDWEISGNRYIL